MSITHEQAVQALDNMTVIQLIQLTKELEEKWGVEAKPQLQQAVQIPTNQPQVSTQTEFTVVLQSIAADKKINVIKTARELLSLTLLDSKALIESLPKTVKEGVSKEEAEELKRKLTEAGGTVEIK